MSDGLTIEQRCDLYQSMEEKHPINPLAEFGEMPLVPSDVYDRMDYAQQMIKLQAICEAVQVVSVPVGNGLGVMVIGFPLAGGMRKAIFECTSDAERLLQEIQAGLLVEVVHWFLQPDDYMRQQRRIKARHAKAQQIKQETEQ